jgi:hypothetical protein
VLRRAGAIDEAGYARPLAFADQRAELRLGAVGRSERQPRHRARQIGDDLLVDLGAGEDAARRRAVLAGVVVAEGAHALDHGVDVGVVVDDHRRLAAELEMRPLDRLGGRFEHAAPGRDVAGQRDHVDAGVRDQRRPHRLATSEHEVEHAGGEQLGDDLRELQRRERRLLRRLEHHRVPCRQRRRHLPRRHHQRIVPRCDRSDDADGVAADHAGEAREIFARGAAGHAARRAGEEPEAVDDRRQLVLPHPS